MGIKDWSPEKITKEHVHQAAKIWREKNGVWENFRQSIKYDVIIEGKPYPPKPICSIAHGLATGKKRKIRANELAGAKKGIWHKTLKGLGFTISEKSATQQSVVEQYGLDDTKAIEGYEQDRQITTNKRNRSIVKKCKARDKHTCQVCNFHMEINGKFIIECHHINPIAEVGVGEILLKDLVCLCPTCHRIAHTRNPPYLVSEMKIFKTANELQRQQADNLQTFFATLQPLDSFATIDAEAYVDEMRSKSRLIND